MTISFMIRALALTFLASTASAQTSYAPGAPAASMLETNRTGDDAAPVTRVAQGRSGSSDMLAALARVQPGLYTNNEMIRIEAARSSGDTAVLRFILSHDNRLNAGEPTFRTNDAPTYSPVAPMGGRGPNR